MNKKIKIAIQKNGKLFQDSERFLRSLGMNFNFANKILNLCGNYDMDIIMLRDDDIPLYVSNGWVDFGIVGEDVFYEADSPAILIKKIGFGRCSMVLAVPKDGEITCISKLQDKKIATSYPNLTMKFLQKNNIKAEIITLSGSVEIAPALGLADAIVDIAQTGKTLRENNLSILETLFDSQAILIANPNLKNNIQEKNIFYSICKSLAQNNLILSKS